MQKDRIFYLDFIRSIAVLLIIFFHYNCATTRIVSSDVTLFPYYGYAGTLGVSMFFILSGASLTLSTQNNYSIIDFYKKRFAAIFPLFWFTYILLTLVRVITAQPNPFAGRNPLTFILTICGLDGFLLYKIPNYYLIGEWFLGCLIILYILFPLIRHVFNINKSIVLVASFVFIVLIAKTYNFSMRLEMFPLFRVFEFIFGMYFVTACRDNFPGQKYALLISAVAGFLVFSTVSFQDNPYISNIILGVLSFIFLSAFANIFERYLPRKTIRFLSKYSFAAFLVHHVTLIRIVSYSKDTVLLPHYKYALFVVTLLTIYLFAFATYSSLEAMRNFLALGKTAQKAALKPEGEKHSR